MRFAVRCRRDPLPRACRSRFSPDQAAGSGSNSSSPPSSPPCARPSRGSGSDGRGRGHDRGHDRGHSPGHSPGRCHDRVSAESQRKGRQLRYRFNPPKRKIVLERSLTGLCRGRGPCPCAHRRRGGGCWSTHRTRRCRRCRRHLDDASWTHRAPSYQVFYFGPQKKVITRMPPDFTCTGGRLEGPGGLE